MSDRPRQLPTKTRDSNDRQREARGSGRLCIAHGGDIGEPSGGTDRVSALASGLAGAGVDVTLVVPEPSGSVPGRLDVVDVEYVDAPHGGALGRAAAVASTAERIARERDATLQFEHSTLAGVATLRGSSGYVLDMHDLGYSRYDHVDSLAAPMLKRAVKTLEKRAVERASHIVVVSEVMREMLRELWEVPADRLSVVPNGYFPEVIPDPEAEPTVPGRVAFLGTLHPKVDVESLLAVARLPEVSELVVVGDGAQRQRLERLGEGVESLRVTGRLPDDEAFALMAEAEVLVNPQAVSDIQRSSSPVKLFYYAALGKPMVVTPGPSVVHHLVERRAAITAYSKGSFAERVRSALVDDALAGRLGAQARDAATTFQWSRRVDALGDVYSRPIGGERA